MLYRAATVGIVAFWLVMMGLLVRLETHPEETDILDVPVSYVARIMFRHGQQSLLTVHDQTKAIGTISLRPSVTGSDGRSLDFSGTLALQLPMGPRMQRVNFGGTLNMDVALRLADFHLDLTLQQPHLHLNVKGNTRTKTFSYQVSQGDQAIASQTLPLDPSSIGPALLQNMGVDTRAIPISLASVSSIAPPAVTARETQIALGGEQVQVYQVTVAEGTVPVIDLYVTELGQVVLAKTNFGYTLSAEDWQ